MSRFGDSPFKKAARAPDRPPAPTVREDPFPNRAPAPLEAPPVSDSAPATFGEPGAPLRGAPIPPRPLGGQRGKIFDAQNVGTQQETAATVLRGIHKPGDVITAGHKDDADVEKRFRVLAVDDEVVGIPGMSKYTLQPASIFAPVQESLDVHADGVSKWSEMREAEPEDKTAFEGPAYVNTSSRLASTLPEHHGSPTDIFTAYEVEYLVRGQLNQFKAHLEQNVPGSIDGYLKASKEAGWEKRGEYPTLDVDMSLQLALQDMSELWPDHYTQRLGTEAGMDELYGLALMRLTTVAPKELNFGVVRRMVTENLQEVTDFESLVDVPFDIGGDVANLPRELAVSAEEIYIPEVPFLKDTIIRATDLFLDPIFLATLPIMPGVGLLSKTATLGAFAAGGAVGEETAEALGIPEPVGGLAGMIAGPAVAKAAAGFTRAIMNEGLARAFLKPVMGEPAFEALVKNGQVLELPELNAALGIKEPTIFFHGVDDAKRAEQLLKKGFKPGEDAFLSSEPDLAQRFGARRGGKSPTVLEIEVPADLQLGGRDAIRTIAKEDLGRVTIRRSLSAEEAALTGEEARVFRTPVAGGSGKSLNQFFRQLIDIHIERPEAQDLLRKMAQAGADRWVGFKKVVEKINVSALATTATLKAAVGYEAMAGYDTALRRSVMAHFRGKRVPFRQNHKAQIWLPGETKAAIPGKAAAVDLKKGEWMSFGDVAESVMKGEKKFLSRLTEKQVQWIGEARSAFEPFIRVAEDLTGEVISKRAAWWPRYVDDISNKRWQVNAGPGKPPGFFARVIDSQQAAIEEYGIRYKPDILEQMESAITGMQKVSRDVTLNNYLKEEGVIRLATQAAPKTRNEVFADILTPKFASVRPGVMSTDHMNDIQQLLGRAPAGINRQAAKVNSVARLLMTGVLDTGVGALQLTTLFAVNPQKWGEAMGRSFFNMLVEPKQFYRFLENSPAAKQYIKYGGNVGLESEFSAATRLSVPGKDLLPDIVQKGMDVVGFVPGSFINRMQVGFDSALSYGRIFAFDAMMSPAVNPGPLLRLAGAKPLSGQALHDEMFRLARFTDTLLGQPEIRGIISRGQEQFESAWMWFAPRYTRSMLGTMSYLVGKGYAPAQARVVLSKMLIGGMAIMSGIIAGVGAAQGKSMSEIAEEIKIAMNPLSGKAYMSKKLGKDWFGMGGVYRAGFAATGNFAGKDNWKMEEWDERILDNPFMRVIRSRTAPFTGTLMDFLEGENFLGGEMDFWEMVDDPTGLGKEYLVDNFAPFSLGGLFQEGGWERKTARFAAEFFGLRSSPESAFESLAPVLDRVSQEHFGIPFDQLEHNLPAQDLVRNSPAAKGVESGFVLPLARSKEEKSWEVYRELRDGIRDEFAGKKDNLDVAFQHGGVSGREFREQYREIQAAEFNQLLSSREALTESLGLDFTGGDEAPRGTVDHALSAYFDLELEDYQSQHPDTLATSTDWDGWFADRDAALAEVPDEFVDLVDTYLSRHQSEIAKDFRHQFDGHIRPAKYFEAREVMSEIIGIPLNEIENAAIEVARGKGERASPFDIGNDVDGFIDRALAEKFGENVLTIKKWKDRARELNPELDIELFRQGYTSTVRSLAAVQLGVELAKSKPDLGYFKPPLAEDVRKDLGR